MSYNQSKIKRVRASSAKVSNQRVRPSSGNSNKNVNKVGFIENIYGGLFTTKPNLGYLGEEIDVPKPTQSKTFKQKEQLIEQNMQLKKQINQLKQQLSLQKGKTQQFRKKNLQFTKKLNRQYQKQLYWNNGPNMVRGVKQQYEQIKLKYEQKCLEYDLLTQQYIFSQSREDRAYIDILQSQNHKLSKRLKQAQQQIRYSKHGTLTSAVQQSIQLYKRYKFQIQQQNENLSEEVRTLKSEVTTLKEQLDNRDKKIGYLQKLLIERDNSQHSAWRKTKKLQKEKQDIVSQYFQYKKQKEESAYNYESKLKRIRETLQKQSEAQAIIFRNQLQQKQQRICKLQKEIAYLTTLLSYWKPLDQINHLASNNLAENQYSAEYDKEVILEYSMGSTMIKYNVSKQNHRLPSNEEEYQTKSIVAKSRRGSQDNNYKNVSDVMTKSIDITKKEVQHKKRTQITADKRNTQQGVKSRKITHNEIVDICQTLKYRFIGFSIPIEQIKKYFDYDGDLQMVQNQEDQAWSKQYISMKQVNQILQNDIFGLNEADSLSLSRYLIEDSPNDYVYCDPNNQNLRSVVKSIIKNAIGDYQIFKNKNQVAQQARQNIHKYQTNLDSALRATAPKGLISKKKLLQLFKGLGIELSEQVQDYLVGKIVIKSQNLNNLRYSILFEK